MANSPMIERFLNEYKAQDMSTFMEVMVAGKRIRVATYDDGNQMWVPTQDGKDLLNPPPVEEVKPVTGLKNINVKPAK